MQSGSAMPQRNTHTGSHMHDLVMADILKTSQNMLKIT